MYSQLSIGEVGRICHPLGHRDELHAREVTQQRRLLGGCGSGAGVVRNRGGQRQRCLTVIVIRMMMMAAAVTSRSRR